MSSVVPLTQAVTAGDANAVSAALASGADINERNNGGQTALILAVIFGHTDLVRLLMKAGANPRLRDNLGLDAVEWAQRRGLTEAVELFTSEPATQPVREIRVVEKDPPRETPIDTDEKSRKWLAGVKQRIQEQSLREQPVIPSEPEPEPEPVTPEPEPLTPKPKPVTPEPEPLPPAPKASSTRKRCPQCNRIYNSELVAYCAHHVVALVDADEPFVEPRQSTTAAFTNTVTNTPLLWTFILVTVSIAAFTTYMITSQLSNVVTPDTPASAQQQPQSFMKGTPVAGGDLAGKALTLAEAKCPVFEDDARSRTNGTSETVNVHLKVDKRGKVFWARPEGGDEAMRNAATEAATNSTFSPDKLRGRETQGTITYTFAP